MTPGPRATDPIYHLAPLGDLRAGLTPSHYTPPHLAEDGFVHCAGSREAALAVALDYFGDLDEPLVVLMIDPDRLASTLRFETPAPRPGAGRGHLERADLPALYPHVYGPIDVAAVREAGCLARDAAGYGWPARFGPLAALVARS